MKITFPSDNVQGPVWYEIVWNLSVSILHGRFFLIRSVSCLPKINGREEWQGAKCFVGVWYNATVLYIYIYIYLYIYMYIFIYLYGLLFLHNITPLN